MNAKRFLSRNYFVHPAEFDALLDSIGIGTKAASRILCRTVRTVTDWRSGKRPVPRWAFELLRLRELERYEAWRVALHFSTYHDRADVRRRYGLRVANDASAAEGSRLAGGAAAAGDAAEHVPRADPPSCNTGVNCRLRWQNDAVLTPDRRHGIMRAWLPRSAFRNPSSSALKASRPSWASPSTPCWRSPWTPSSPPAAGRGSDRLRPVEVAPRPRRPGLRCRWRSSSGCMANPGATRPARAARGRSSSAATAAAPQRERGHAARPGTAATPRPADRSAGTVRLQPGRHAVACPAQRGRAADRPDDMPSAAVLAFGTQRFAGALAPVPFGLSRCGAESQRKSPAALRMPRA